MYLIVTNDESGLQSLLDRQQMEVEKQVFRVSE